MKAGKDEELMIMMSPMFPRLHVNDTEKGGPRAPPRNKMALYEQLSIPSQRFTSGSASMSPLPPSNGSRLVPSTSSSHVGVQERNVFAPISSSCVPSHFREKHHSYSFSAVELNISMAIHDQNSSKPTNFPTSNAMGHLSSSTKCDLLRPHDLSNSKDSFVKKLRGTDEVSKSVNSEISPHFSKIQPSIGMENLPHLSSKTSIQFQSACEMEKKGSGTAELKSRQHVRSQIEGNPKVSRLTENHTQMISSILSIRDKILADASSSPLKDNISESLKRKHTSSNEENRSSSVEGMRRLHDANKMLHQQCMALQENIARRDGVLVEPKVIGKSNSFQVGVESCSKPSYGHDHKSSTGLENGSKCGKDGECGSIHGGDVSKNDDVSDTSMVDSISCLNLSPDDIVRVIGEKQFWKARREIVKQQRVFAVQVFELHRLIKVQKLIAKSPHLLLEDNLITGKPLFSVSPAKKLASEFISESLPLIVKPKYDSQKANSSTECVAENAVGKLNLPSLNKDANKRVVSQGSHHGPCSGNIPLASMATDVYQTPWCYHPPPGNQWLVPVMSPSQGLVYKPYSGPCPPTAGFMAPIYGSCGPISLSPIPPTYQQGIEILPGTTPLAQTYFPPYAMPIMNPSISSSAVEQMSPFPKARLNPLDNQVSTRDINFTMPYQSSCNMSSETSGAKSCYAGKFQLSKCSDLRVSTASSPSEKEPQEDTIPLFSMEPTVQISKQPNETRISKQQTQVIKVVPHNPQSATESAARIFQSIQEERKYYN